MRHSNGEDTGVGQGVIMKIKALNIQIWITLKSSFLEV